MGGLILKWLMGGGWKTIIGALLVGGFIAGIATLFGAWQIEKGQSAKYQAERDAARTLTATYEKHLDVCLGANSDWEITAARWNARIDELTLASESYLDDLNRERARRRAAAARLEELLAAADADITAVDCEGALDQLIESLGWGVTQ
jgi:hypothetical protein